VFFTSSEVGNYAGCILIWQSDLQVK